MLHVKKRWLAAFFSLIILALSPMGIHAGESDTTIRRSLDYVRALDMKRVKEATEYYLRQNIGEAGFSHSPDLTYTVTQYGPIGVQFDRERDTIGLYFNLGVSGTRPEAGRNDYLPEFTLSKGHDNRGRTWLIRPESDGAGWKAVAGHAELSDDVKAAVTRGIAALIKNNFQGFEDFEKPPPPPPPEPSTVTVTLKPPEAVARGAKWRFSNEPNNWHESGETVGIKSVGDITIQFKNPIECEPIPDYKFRVSNLLGEYETVEKEFALYPSYRFPNIADQTGFAGRETKFRVLPPIDADRDAIIAVRQKSGSFSGNLADTHIVGADKRLDKDGWFSYTPGINDRNLVFEFMLTGKNVPNGTTRDVHFSVTGMPPKPTPRTVAATERSGELTVHLVTVKNAPVFGGMWRIRDEKALADNDHGWLNNGETKFDIPPGKVDVEFRVGQYNVRNADGTISPIPAFKPPLIRTVDVIGGAVGKGATLVVPVDPQPVYEFFAVPNHQIRPGEDISFFVLPPENMSDAVLKASYVIPGDDEAKTVVLNNGFFSLSPPIDNPFSFAVIFTASKKIRDILNDDEAQWRELKMLSDAEAAKQDMLSEAEKEELRKNGQYFEPLSDDDEFTVMCHMEVQPLPSAGQDEVTMMDGAGESQSKARRMLDDLKNGSHRIVTIEEVKNPDGPWDWNWQFHDALLDISVAGVNVSIGRDSKDKQNQSEVMWFGDAATREHNWEERDETLFQILQANKDRIRSLSIYALDVEILDRLELPQTNVRIFARNLSFKGDDAAIVTTPLAPPGAPPVDDNVSFDKAGQLQNVQHDPKNGLNAGDIDLAVESVKVQRSSAQGDKAAEYKQGERFPKARLITVGGKGEDRPTIRGHNGRNGDAKNDDGGDGLPHGKPGAGGEAGKIVALWDLSWLVDNDSGENGNPGPLVWGGRPRVDDGRLRWGLSNIVTPEAVEEINKEAAEKRERIASRDTTNRYIEIAKLSKPTTSYPYGTYGENKNKRVLVAGADRLTWLHPLALEQVLAFVRECYIEGCYELAYQTLESVRLPLEAFNGRWSGDAEIERDLAVQYQTINARMLQLASGLDYFGNPRGWVPNLSLELAMNEYQNQIGRAMRTYYLYSWLNRNKENEDGSIAAQFELLDQAARENESLTAEYNRLLTGDLNNINVQISDINNKLKACEKEMADIMESIRRDAERIIREEENKGSGLLRKIGREVGKPFTKLSKEARRALNNVADFTGLDHVVDGALKGLSKVTPKFLRSTLPNSYGEIFFPTRKQTVEKARIGGMVLSFIPTPVCQTVGRALSAGVAIAESEGDITKIATSLAQAYVGSGPLSENGKAIADFAIKSVAAIDSERNPTAALLRNAGGLLGGSTGLDLSATSQELVTRASEVIADRATGAIRDRDMFANLGQALLKSTVKSSDSLSRNPRVSDVLVDLTHVAKGIVDKCPGGSTAAMEAVRSLNRLELGQNRDVVSFAVSAAELSRNEKDFFTVAATLGKEYGIDEALKRKAGELLKNSPFSETVDGMKDWLKAQEDKVRTLRNAVRNAEFDPKMKQHLSALFGEFGITNSGEALQKWYKEQEISIRVVRDTMRSLDIDKELKEKAESILASKRITREEVSKWLKEKENVVRGMRNSLPVGNRTPDELSGVPLDLQQQAPEGYAQPEIHDVRPEWGSGMPIVDAGMELSVGSEFAQAPASNPEVLPQYTHLLSDIIGVNEGLLNDLIYNRIPNDRVGAKMQELMSSNPLYQSLYRKMSSNIAERENVATELMYTLSGATSRLAKMAENARKMDKISDVLTGALQNRRLEARQFVRNMHAEAEDRLHYYHYILGRAYEYRMLKPYDSNYGKLKKVFDELEKKILADGGFNPAGENIADANASGILTKNQGEELYKIYEKPLTDVMQQIIDRCIIGDKTVQTVNTGFDLTDADLAALNESGKLFIDFSERLGIAANRVNLRLDKIWIEDMEVVSKERNNRPMAIDIVHPSSSIISDGERNFYFLHAGADAADTGSKNAADVGMGLREIKWTVDAVFNHAKVITREALENWKKANERGEGWALTNNRIPLKPPTLSGKWTNLVEFATSLGVNMTNTGRGGPRLAGASIVHPVMPSATAKMRMEANFENNTTKISRLRLAVLYEFQPAPIPYLKVFCLGEYKNSEGLDSNKVHRVPLMNAVKVRVTSDKQTVLDGWGNFVRTIRAGSNVELHAETRRGDWLFSRWEGFRFADPKSEVNSINGMPSIGQRVYAVYVYDPVVVTEEDAIAAPPEPVVDQFISIFHGDEPPRVHSEE